MTKREFYELVMTLGNADATAFAQEEIEKMDSRNENRRNSPRKPSKTAESNRVLYFEILKNFCAEPHTASEIGAHLEISAQKASAVMRQAVNEGFATANDIKVKGRTVKSYTWL